MRLTRDIGMLLLGVWLVLTGLFGLVGGGGRAVALILGLLAIAAGALLLLRGERVRTRSYGFILLAIWLIIAGLLAVIPVAIPGAGIILGLLALAAGVLLLLMGGCVGGRG